jgi:hypothetical protein
MTDPTPTERIDAIADLVAESWTVLPQVRKVERLATRRMLERFDYLLPYAHLGAMVDPQLLYQALFMGNRAGRAHLEAVVAAAERIKAATDSDEIGGSR